MEKGPRDHQSACVFCLDVNGLRRINADYGEIEGDCVIESVRECLEGIFGPRAEIRNTGGAAFQVSVPHMDDEAAIKAMERLKQEAPASLAVGYAFCDRFRGNRLQARWVAEDRMIRNKYIDSTSFRNSSIALLQQVLGQISHETEAHANRLIQYAECVCRELAIKGHEKDDLMLLCLLHDIGKILIPVDILEKPENLDESEWELMKTHSQKGYDIVSKCHGLEGIACLVKHHHERYDGSGYPDGLKGREIPYLDRILSVLDAFDAMTHDRPYRTGISRESAMSELQREAGRSFDPAVVEAFIRCSERAEK